MTRRLHGIHHVTAITAEAQPNVDFYAGVLGLRLVKKTVNFDSPDMYHLYFGDETGQPGSVMTFFEIPGALPGRPGAGMVHETRWRVRDAAALDFWAARLTDAGHRDRARRRDAAVRRSGRARSGLRRRRDARRAAGRGARRDPGGARAARFRGSERLQLRPGALDRDARPACPGFERDDDGVARAGRPRLHLALRPGSGRRPDGPAPAPSTTSPGRRAPPSRRSGSRPSRPTAFARARSWTAPTSGRSTSASPPACCSRSPPTAPGFAIDEPVASLGTALRLPPQFESRRTADRGPPTPAEEPARCGLPRVTSRSPRATG